MDIISAIWLIFVAPHYQNEKQLSGLWRNALMKMYRITETLHAEHSWPPGRGTATRFHNFAGEIKSRLKATYRKKGSRRGISSLKRRVAWTTSTAIGRAHSLYRALALSFPLEGSSFTWENHLTIGRWDKYVLDRSNIPAAVLPKAAAAAVYSSNRSSPRCCRCIAGSGKCNYGKITCRIPFGLSSLASCRHPPSSSPAPSHNASPRLPALRIFNNDEYVIRKRVHPTARKQRISDIPVRLRYVYAVCRYVYNTHRLSRNSKVHCSRAHSTAVPRRTRESLTEEESVAEVSHIENQ